MFSSYRVSCRVVPAAFYFCACFADRWYTTYRLDNAIVNFDKF